MSSSNKNDVIVEEGNPNKRQRTSKTIEDDTDRSSAPIRPNPVRSRSVVVATAAAAADNLSAQESKKSSDAGLSMQESKKSAEAGDDGDNKEHNDDESVKLPTSIELSKELCKIVDTDNYSREVSLLVLEKMNCWVCTQDSDFWKYFNILGGIERVLDFLKTTLDDETCVGKIRWECIGMAACIICNVSVKAIDDINEDIATEIATTAVNYDAIQTLLTANEEYTNGNDTFELGAMKGIWGALDNMFIEEAEIEKGHATSVFDSGIDMMAKLSSVHGSFASMILVHVFSIFFWMSDFVTKKEFQDKDILSLCLKVFENDDKWSADDEKLLEEAIGFFDLCHYKELLIKGSDHVKLLPLCVKGLKNFSTNARIREYACNLLDYGACSSNINKRNVEKAGAVEALATLLTLDGVEDYEKNNLRKLIGDIMAP